jgi:hypothetical protein
MERNQDSRKKKNETMSFATISSRSVAVATARGAASPVRLLRSLAEARGAAKPSVAERLRGRVIGVEGNIGSGKSTFTRAARAKILAESGAPEKRGSDDDIGQRSGPTGGDGQRSGPTGGDGQRSGPTGGDGDGERAADRESKAMAATVTTTVSAKSAAKSATDACVVHGEKVNTEFLGALYQQPQRYAFAFQGYMLTTRYRRLLRAHAHLQFLRAFVHRRGNRVDLTRTHLVSIHQMEEATRQASEGALVLLDRSAVGDTLFAIQNYLVCLSRSPLAAHTRARTSQPVMCSPRRLAAAAVAAVVATAVATAPTSWATWTTPTWPCTAASAASACPRR